ncbi:hypothetical protein N5923_00780 [Erwiniaceae bacterium BAC15a-03b]|uniref:Uncharacterized protein n=1 Tax=Winslowiella arboricola TaxID=2978220 RepID=A0A9J6PPQ6_9GAMM|nr:hypothetical protein [Winslowiella arboricola]MCU5772176.1 hypothetical protein [Winslowiella arboricola]MCU5776031.1 hypothetical protein [Winslowiella arboricola]
MKKLKKFAAACLVIIIGFLLIDCSMQKVAERHEGYTQSNIWAYYFYTDSEIRNAPRVSESWHFAFTALDGSLPRESSIIYSSDARINDVKIYLTSLGFREVARDGQSARWERKGEVMPYFTISFDPVTHNLTLSRASFR